MVRDMPTLPHQLDQEATLVEWGRRSLSVKEVRISLLRDVLQML